MEFAVRQAPPGLTMASRLSLSRVTTTVSGQWRSLADRLRRTTPRERLLIGGLVAAGLIYGPLTVYEWRQGLQDAYMDALVARNTARLAQATALRLDARLADEAALDDMQGWTFKAGNLAIAQVQIEQRLVESATEAGLGNFKITTDPKVEDIAPTQWLGAEIQSDLRWSPTFAFLDDLAEWPEGFRVTRFKYDLNTLPLLIPRQNAGAPLLSGRIQLGVSFPVTLTDTESGGPAGPAT